MILRSNISTHSALSNLNWAAAGHTIDANVNFVGFAAVAMLCDNGPTLPTSPPPTSSQWFCHITTGRKILYIYNGSDWVSIISIGSMTVYVGYTLASDDQDLGFGNESGESFATIQFAVNTIPGLVGGNVIIYINTGTYNESLVIQGKNFTGNYTITPIGTLTQIASASQTGSVQGSGATQGDILDTNNNVSSYDHKLLHSSNNNEYRIIDYTPDADTMRVCGSWSAAPTGTYTVYDWGTVITGVISLELKSGQLGIISQNIKFNGSAEQNVIINSGCFYQPIRCFSTAQTELRKFSVFKPQQSLWERAQGKFYTVFAYGAHMVPTQCKFWVFDDTRGNLLLSAGCLLEFNQGGNIIDNGDNGILNVTGSYFNAFVAPVGSNIIKNCTIGLSCSFAGNASSTGTITYTNNGTDNNADAGSFGYIA